MVFVEVVVPWDQHRHERELAGKKYKYENHTTIMEPGLFIEGN